MSGIEVLLSHAATSRCIKKRVVLICQGDIPQHVTIVKSGCVKVYRVTANGNEQIAGFKTAGDIFPEGWVFGHVTKTMYYYETVEDSEILTVDKQVFLDALEQSPNYKQKYFEYMVRNYSGLMIQIAALEQSYAEDKILMMLYYMMMRHSAEKKPGEFWVLMKLSHETIAGLTGLTRETVTAEMGKLKRQGVVKYSTKKFVIHRGALKERLGDETFAEVQLS